MKKKEEKELTVKLIKRLSHKAEDMMKMLEKHKYVFTDLDNKWQKLAFTFYSEIVQLSCDAKEILAEKEAL